MIGDGGHAKVIRSINPNANVIAVGDNAARKKEATTLCTHLYEFDIVIHPGAIVDSSARIGAGTVVMAGAVIQADAVIGKHCIINTGASVDHDCVLEDFVHIAPGAHLCGTVHVGEGTLVGVGVGVAPNTKIPAWSLVKANPLHIVPKMTSIRQPGEPS